MKRFYTLFVALLVLGGLINIASAQNVEFRDANLAGKVRSALNLPAGAAIPKAQLGTLTVLDASASEEYSSGRKNRQSHRLGTCSAANGVKSEF